MFRGNIFSAVCAVALLASSAIAQPAPTSSQTQSQTSGSQYSTQNDSLTYQSSYQVNHPSGAAQGQGVGVSQAQSDYNASSAIRDSTGSPYGSYQEQSQTISSGVGGQQQSTRPPNTPARVRPQ